MCDILTPGSRYSPYYDREMLQQQQLYGMGFPLLGPRQAAAQGLQGPPLPPTFAEYARAQAARFGAPPGSVFPETWQGVRRRSDMASNEIHVRIEMVDNHYLITAECKRVIAHDAKEVMEKLNSLAREYVPKMLTELELEWQESLQTARKRSKKK